MNTAIRRGLIVALGLGLQIGFWLFVFFFLDEQFELISVFLDIIGAFVVLNIIRDSRKLSNDIPWIILILVFPIFGTVLFLITRSDLKTSQLFNNIIKEEKKNKNYLVQDEKIKKEIKRENLDVLNYLVNNTNYPVTKNNKVVYYDFGEKFYPEYLKELKKAKKFIFMEYFIIDDGKMWRGILEILKEKAEEGVEVRLIYDDVGSLSMLPENFPKVLGKFGIKCIPFNKISPLKGLFMNNRDHRKMTIIDGRVAFSGGLNLADEYINEVSRFGTWKDNAIKIEGGAILNLTVMFLNLWNANLKTDSSYEKYLIKSAINTEDGLVLPYGLSPVYDELIGEDVYINMINSAKDYLYIMTPYLIVDTDMENALIRAAKRGVDVNIVVPGIPDKKLVYTLTTSFFETLHKNGVKIHIYKKGFVHSKMFVVDDKRAVVGTINLDYRSLYLHFENGVYLENVSEIKAMKKDFEDTFKDCKILEDKDVKTGIFKASWQAILRLFAPLL